MHECGDQCMGYGTCNEKLTNAAEQLKFHTVPEFHSLEQDLVGGGGGIGTAAAVI